MNERVIQEIIESNEMLRIQMWILGGVIIVMLAIVSGFVNSAWKEVKSMLFDHGQRIMKSEKDIIAIQNKRR